jgi:hypothetical protein
VSHCSSSFWEQRWVDQRGEGDTVAGKGRGRGGVVEHREGGGGLGAEGLEMVRWYEERGLEVWHKYWVVGTWVGWFKGGAGV